MTTMTQQRRYQVALRLVIDCREGQVVYAETDARAHDMCQRLDQGLSQPGEYVWGNPMQPDQALVTALYEAYRHHCPDDGMKPARQDLSEYPLPDILDYVQGQVHDMVQILATSQTDMKDSIVQDVKAGNYDDAISGLETLKKVDDIALNGAGDGDLDDLLGEVEDNLQTVVDLVEVYNTIVQETAR